MSMKRKFQWWQVKGLVDVEDDFVWLQRLMGDPDYTARWWYESSSNCFYFRQQKDAMLFELMWSEDESKRV